MRHEWRRRRRLSARRRASGRAVRRCALVAARAVAARCDKGFDALVQPRASAEDDGRVDELAECRVPVARLVRDAQHELPVVQRRGRVNGRVARAEAQRVGDGGAVHIEEQPRVEQHGGRKWRAHIAREASRRAGRARVRARLGGAVGHGIDAHHEEVAQLDGLKDRAVRVVHHVAHHRLRELSLIHI